MIFRCTVDAAHLIWNLDHVQLSSLTEQTYHARGIYEVDKSQNGSVISSGLLAQAREENHGLLVQCLAFGQDFGSNDPSAIALLSVYGPPETPQNLTSTIVAPFDVNISWVVSSSNQVQFTYLLNVTDGSEVLESYELDNPYFLYTFMQGIPNCDYRGFAVAERNGAGESKPSEVLLVTVPTRMYLLPMKYTRFIFLYFILTTTEVFQQCKLTS